MRFFLLFVALSFWHLSLCGAEAVASSDPNVDYILRGRSERIATYMKCSLSDEYCMCVEQVVGKGGEVFRCSVFLHTNNAYIGRTHLFRKRRNLQNVRAKYRHYRGAQI